MKSSNQTEKATTSAPERVLSTQEEAKLTEILNTDASLVEGYALLNGPNQQSQHQRTLAPA